MVPHIIELRNTVSGKDVGINYGTYYTAPRVCRSLAVLFLASKVVPGIEVVHLFGRRRCGILEGKFDRALDDQRPSGVSAADIQAAVIPSTVKAFGI